MTKTKLAFVRCRLSCFSCRPVRFFPVFSLLPVCCCSPVVVFAVRHWDLPAFSRGGFFAIVFLFFLSSFPSRRPVRFFPSFPFCRYFPSLFAFHFVAFCIWSFFSAFLFSLFSVLFFLFYREAASGRKTGGHGRRMALKLFLPMARQKETPPKRGNFYK